MNEQLKEAVSEAIREALGGALDCGRVWSAWGVGTMSEDDFSPVADDSERVAEITDAVLSALAATGKQQVGEVQGDARAHLIEEAIGYLDLIAVQPPLVDQARRALARALASRQPVYVQGSDELRARTDGERAAYLEGIEEGKVQAARQPGVQVPVAVVGSDFTLLWAGSGPIAPMVERHGLKRGSLLYAAPPAQGIDLGQLREKLTKLTRRNEFISGQSFSYVQLDDVLALIDQRDAAPGVGS